QRQSLSRGGLDLLALTGEGLKPGITKNRIASVPAYGEGISALASGDWPRHFAGQVGVEGCRF
ncbi:MAG: hypothetical protein WCS94_20715, partial [Verrucomicrobiota bacterium]